MTCNKRTKISDSINQILFAVHMKKLHTGWTAKILKMRWIDAHADPSVCFGYNGALTLAVLITLNNIIVSNDNHYQFDLVIH